MLWALLALTGVASPTGINQEREMKVQLSLRVA